MSAWYVFATLGFYPVQSASGTYVAGIPLVRRAHLRVAGHAALTIERTGSGDRLLRITLDGQPISARAIPHGRITRGGTLRFVAGRHTS